jgi:Tfp pilus assembly protein PilO
MAFKRTNNKVTELLLVIGIFLAALVVMYIVLWMPAMRKAESFKAQLREKQHVIQEAEGLIRTVPNPKKAIEDLEKKAEEFKDIELNKKQIPRIINLLGRSISGRDITLIAVRPRDDIKTDAENLPAGVSKVYIEMILSCSYRDLGEYLDALTKLPLTFIIDSLNITKQQAAPVQPESGKAKSQEKGRDKKEGPIVATILFSTYMVWEM